jgi:hypothetical protein
MPHPEKEYKYEDFWERNWEPGPSPISPEEGLHPSPRQMKSEITRAVTYVHRPFIMDMVYKYLLLNDPEGAVRFEWDSANSRSRFGFRKSVLLGKMFNNMPEEELAAYWNSIVNYQILPLVNEEEAKARFGGGELGKALELRWDPTSKPHDVYLEE